MRNTLLPIAFCLAALLAVGQTAFAQTQLNSCDQFVAGDVELAMDLDCTGSAAAVTLRDGAELNLGGFQITGAPIRCDLRCSVRGPGTTSEIVATTLVLDSATVNGAIQAVQKVTITGSTVNAAVGGHAVVIGSSTIQSPDHTCSVSGIRVSITDSTVANCGTGVSSDILVLVSSTVRDSSGAGVTCRGCTITDSDILDNGGQGINCKIMYFPTRDHLFDLGTLKMYGSTVSGNGYSPPQSATPLAIDCARSVLIVSSEVTNNAGGIRAYARNDFTYQNSHDMGKVTIYDSHITGNGTGGTGVSAYRQAKIYGSVVTGNDEYGVSGGTQVLLDATQVTGNALACPTCVDVLSGALPKLQNGATCGTSGGNNGSSWGICSLD